MRGFKFVVFAICGAVIIAFVLIVMQPDNVHIEKDIFIKSTPQLVRAELENSDNLDLWSPWNKETPESRIKVVSLKDFGSLYYSELIVSPESEGTRVKLIYDAAHDNLWSKCDWFFKQRNIEHKYEEGLTKLKNQVEGG